MSDRVGRGNTAETLALEFLNAQGLELLERNFRCRTGEIDLIMRDDATLVFVEVRYRRSGAYGGAAGSVDRRKQQRVTRAALYFLAISLLILLAGDVPACEAGALPTCRDTLLAEVNAERVAADLQPVAVHPVLSDIASDRAQEIAGGGSVAPSMARLQATTTRLYREGYVPHDWTESSLIGRWDGEIFGQWREVHSRWYKEVRAGDYEHVGIGIREIATQPVYTLVFGLTKRTMEWRLAAPLSELDRVRSEILSEVNAVRSARGRVRLRSNPVLDDVAQRHAAEMLRRSFYDHRSPDGDTLDNRLREAGYGRVRAASENLAKGLFTPGEVVERWMASSGHRSNILEKKVRELGSGVAFGENDNGFEVTWVQVFAAKKEGG